MKESTYDQFSLEDELLRECEAMVKHALTSGMKVPATVVQRLDSLADQLQARKEAAKGKVDTPGSEKGETTDNTVLENQAGNIARELTVVHGSLVGIVAPATPRTLLLLAKEEAGGSIWLFLGRVPLIRRFILVAILSLIALVAISSLTPVNGHVDWQKDQGIHLLLEELFLISAAAIGASFIALFEANRFIKDGTYDPQYDSSYWTRFVLGIIAGMILAMLIPLGKLDPSTNEIQGPMGAMTKPTLAMLGGFSAKVVYRILRRLVDTVESLVRGEARDLVAAQGQAASARYAEQEAQNRISLATSLTKLQQQLNASGDPEAIRGELDRILNKLVPPDEDEQVSGTLPAQKDQGNA